MVSESILIGSHELRQKCRRVVGEGLTNIISSTTDMNLLLLLNFAAICYCFIPEHFIESMDAETANVARSIPVAGVDQDSQVNNLVKVMVWAVNNNREDLRDLVKNLLVPRNGKLPHAVNRQNLEIVVETLGLAENTDFWFREVKNCIDGDSGPESLEYFKMLMKYPFPEAKLLTIESLCIYRISHARNHFFLSAMMECESLPVKKENLALSNEWYQLLLHLIEKDDFRRFRMIVADWWNFKVRTNLGNIEEAFSGPIHRLSLLSAAKSRGNQDMVWLLVGRSWVFRSFQLSQYRRHNVGKDVFSMIPELYDVEWEPKGANFNPQTAMKQFIMTLMEKYPDHVDAQVVILTSQYCPHDIEQYIKDAIKHRRVNQVIAAAKTNKLQPEHLHLVHMGGDLFKPAHTYINSYLWPIDISRLQYRDVGPVPMIVLGCKYFFKGRALKLMEWVIPQMGKHMKTMDIFTAFDKVYALKHMEEQAHKDLKLVSSELAEAFMLDPAEIPTDHEAGELLMFYAENEYTGFAYELILRSSIDRRLSLFEKALQTGKSQLIIFLLDPISKRKDLTIEQQNTLYTQCLTFAKNSGDGSVLDAVLRHINRPLDWIFIKKAVILHDYLFFTLIINAKSYSLEEYEDILKFVYANGDEEVFECLWPKIKDLRLCGIRELSQSALFSGKTRIVTALLKHGYSPQSTIIPELLRKRDFKMIEVIARNNIKCYEWSTNNNELLHEAIGAGEKDLVLALLRSGEVFKEALESDDALQMFPELKEVRGLPLNVAHAMFFKRTP